MVVFVKVPEEDNNTGEDGGEITLPTRFSVEPLIFSNKKAAPRSNWLRGAVFV